MLRMQSDIVPVFEAMAHQRLSAVELQWKREAAACVVLASKGYPKDPEDGQVIHGLEKIPPHLQVFHAGTLVDIEDASRVLTKGGRILTVATTGTTVQDAAEEIYKHIGQLHFDGVQYRTDIGK